MCFALDGAAFRKRREGINCYKAQSYKKHVPALTAFPV